MSKRGLGFLVKARRQASPAGTDLVGPNRTRSLPVVAGVAVAAGVSHSLNSCRHVSH